LSPCPQSGSGLQKMSRSDLQSTFLTKSLRCQTTVEFWKLTSSIDINFLHGVNANTSPNRNNNSISVHQPPKKKQKSVAQLRLELRIAESRGYTRESIRPRSSSDLVLPKKVPTGQRGTSLVRLRSAVLAITLSCLFGLVDWAHMICVVKDVGRFLNGR
jgi:hypothetical protein